MPVLWLGTAERISAVVEMNRPGVWVMGDLADDDRTRGMGIVIEYAGKSGRPNWTKPVPFKWDYTRFQACSDARSPDETIDMIFTKNNAANQGFNEWRINDVPFSMDKMEPMFRRARESAIGCACAMPATISIRYICIAIALN